MVRSANTGISCFISPLGEISSIINDDGREIFIDGISTADVDTFRGRSFYTEYGDLFIYFCVFMLIVIVGLEMLRKKD